MPQRARRRRLQEAPAADCTPNSRLRSTPASSQAQQERRAWRSGFRRPRRGARVPLPRQITRERCRDSLTCRRPGQASAAAPSGGGGDARASGRLPARRPLPAAAMKAQHRLAWAALVCFLAAMGAAGQVEDPLAPAPAPGPGAEPPPAAAPPALDGTLSKREFLTICVPMWQPLSICDPAQPPSELGSCFARLRCPARWRVRCRRRLAPLQRVTPFSSTSSLQATSLGMTSS